VEPTVQTENKLDIIMRNNDKGSCVLIDVTIFGDRNVIKRDDVKILKYKDLKTEIQHMWNVKTKVTGNWNHLNT